MKYEEMCKEILTYVGGNTNIADVFNCMTRLRITVNDKSKVDLTKLEKVSGIVKVNVVGKQFQCIIGQQAGDVFSEFVQVSGFNSSDNRAEHRDEQKEKFTWKELGNSILDGISGCIQPLLPAMVCAGLFKFLVALLGPQMLNLLPETSDIIRLLTIVGDAPLHFLPVMIAYTGAKKFGGNVATAFVIGVLMMHPSLIEIVTAGKPFTVYGIPMTLVSYAYSIIPMIMITWLMAHVEKMMKRIVPTMLKTILVPFLTVLIMLPIALCVFGPLGTVIGEYIAGGLLWIPESLGFIGVGIICMLWLPLVTMGLHGAVGTIAMLSFFETGSDSGFMIATIVCMYASAGMMIGFFLKAKNKDNRALGLSCIVSQLLGGISEPGLFGIGLVYKKPYIAMILGAGIGGIISGLLNVSVHVFTGTSTVLNVLGFAGASTSNLVFGILACIVTLIATTIITYVLGFEESAS